MSAGDLVACIVQDADSGDVLMLAWADEEALEATRRTGLVHFHSRSRDELWLKGATSGNTMAVQSIAEDCDGDALLIKVRPARPATPARTRASARGRGGGPTCWASWPG